MCIYIYIHVHTYIKEADIYILKVYFVEWVLDWPSGYLKVDNKYCTHQVHSTTVKWSYENITDAISACNGLFNCTAIYDYGVGIGVYELCFSSSAMHNSTDGSRLYFKSMNF